MTYDCMDAEDRGMCLLAILTINDRVIQLAITQCLQPIIDPDFSAHSYGVSPNRSAYQAVKTEGRDQGREGTKQGYAYAIDIDLSI